MHAYYTAKLMHNDYGFSFFLFLSSLVLVCVVSSPYRRQAAPLAIMTPIFKTLVFPRPMGRQTVLPTPFKNVAMVRRYIIIYLYKSEKWNYNLFPIRFASLSDICWLRYDEWFRHGV